jgi:hypothetical protein
MQILSSNIILNQKRFNITLNLFYELIITLDNYLFFDFFAFIIFTIFWISNNSN